MQYQVPQFVEIEDRIFGPLTIKQFIYIAGAVGIGVVLFMTVPFFLAVILTAPFALLAGALAFYKVNNRPFITVLEAAFNYLFTSKLYLWDHEHQTKRQAKQKKEAEKSVLDKEPVLSVPKLSASKLRDLAWSLDVHDSLYAETDDAREARNKQTRI